MLQMKSMHIDAVANFPFPTPPDRLTLKKAETLLSHLGALAYSTDSASNSGGKVKPSILDLAKTPTRITIGGHITDLGKAMSLFPVSPRFAKMLVAGRQQDTLPYVVAIVAALSVGNPFLHENFIHDNKEDGNEDISLDGAPSELEFIKNPELRAKEIRKLERRQFYKSQQVRFLP